MELKIQKITKFKTPDQREFLSESEAKDYMRELFVRDQLQALLSKDLPELELIDKIPTEDRKGKIIKLFIDSIFHNKRIIVDLFNNTDSIKVE